MSKWRQPKSDRDRVLMASGCRALPLRYARPGSVLLRDFFRSSEPSVGESYSCSTDEEADVQLTCPKS